MEAICKNCNTFYSEHFNYCPNCSQKSKLHRLTFGDIVHEGVHYFTHADKGLFQLIRDLSIKRGLVAYEYIEGKRKKYFPPLNFFLLIAAVFVFMSTLKTVPQDVPITQAYPEVAAIQDPVKKQEAIEVYQRKNDVRYFSDRYSNLLAMLSLPMTALVFWLFYRKAKYNYIEHLVAGMYMLGICILLYALVILPISYLLHISRDIAAAVFMLFQLFYFAVFYCGFLRKRGAPQFFKALGVSLLNLILWIALTISAFSFYVRNGLPGLVN